MNRDMRMWLVIGIAVVTATAASVAMYILTKNAKPPVEAPKVYVVVARKNLEMGEVVAEADVKLMPWPKDGEVAGAFPAIGDVKDRALVAAVLQNEPITKSKLAEKGASGLTPIIKTDMRAMSVKVNEVIGVAGFVTPGTHVDVLVTARRDRDSIARIVAQNVEVLTAGAKYDDPDARKQGKPIPSTVVTLMVTPEDAERISLAIGEGQITLALRNPLDKKEKLTRGYTTPELFAQAVTPKPVVKPPSPTAQKPPPPSPPPPQPAPKVVCFESFKAGKHEVELCP